MRIRLGPPVCVLIIEVVLFERLINILIATRSVGTSTSVLVFSLRDVHIYRFHCALISKHPSLLLA